MPSPLQQVETNLAEIAVSQVSEKNPNLLNYYLGFDLIDKNDDGTRAAGIMGFKIGGQLIYIPVFFLSGKVRGMEIMYLKNTDTFVANSEQWVNYIASQNPTDIGGPSPDKPQNSQGETNNSLRIFSRPPASANSKAASVENMFDLTVDEFICPQIALSEPEHDLVDFLKSAGWDTYKNFVKMATEDPRIFKAVTKMYNIDDLKIQFPSDKIAVKQNGEVSSKKDLKVITLIDPWDLENHPAPCCGDNTDKYKEKVITKGYAIRDLRAEEEKSDIYLGDFKKEFNQVTDTGYYQILNRNSQLVKALVFVGVKPVDGPRSHPSDCFAPQLVIDPESGAYKWSKQPVYYRGGSDLITKLDSSAKSEILDKSGEAVKDAEVGKRYVIIDSKLGVTGPFRVSNKSTEKGKVTLSVEAEYVPYHSSRLLRDGANNSYGCPGVSCGSDYGSKTNIKVTDRETGPVEFISNHAIFVAKDSKLIEIKEAREFSDKSDGKMLEDLITPGEDSALYAAISSNDGTMVTIEKSAAFDVAVSCWDQSNSFRNRGDVVVDLMTRANLSEDSAEKLASEVFDNKSSRVFGWTLPRSLAKFAYPDLINVTGNVGVTRAGTPEQVEQAERQEMVPASPGPRPATEQEFGNWTMPTSDDVSFLERASDSNSRQVFDPAMIGVLVRTSRSQSIVADYIPELVDNLDRMCRLLLLFYWHNSEFADEYGIDEMADFEDLILSTIKSTSKVVLFLKQKAVESSTGQTDVLE